MTTKRKQLKSPIVRSAAPVALAPASPRVTTYPRLADLLREPALASLLRCAMLGGAALSAVAMSGCESPVCEPTRIGELSAHTGQAASLLARLALTDSATEFGVGLGIVPHSSVSVAGDMVAVMPTPLPSAPAPVVADAVPPGPSLPPE